MSEKGEKDFRASRYLTKLNGKDYLEVKWRLLWLRTEHPDAVIVTVTCLSLHSGTIIGGRSLLGSMEM